MPEKITGDVAIDGETLSDYLTRFNMELGGFLQNPTVDSLCEVASWAQAAFAFASGMEGRYGESRTKRHLAEECEGIEWTVQ